MSVWKFVLVTVLAYCFVSVLLFGGPFRAFYFLTFWSGRLGVDYWHVLVLVAAVLGYLATELAVRLGMHYLLIPVVFISISMGLSAVFVGYYAEHQRDRIVEDFEPDVEIRSSIFASYRSAPRDFQFFLHGAVLKDCKPFAWSYRRMAFYELKPSVAPNVLPREWIEKCKIRRTSLGSASVYATVILVS